MIPVITRDNKIWSLTIRKLNIRTCISVEITVKVIPDILTNVRGLVRDSQKRWYPLNDRRFTVLDFSTGKLY